MARSKEIHRRVINCERRLDNTIEAARRGRAGSTVPYGQHWSLIPDSFKGSVAATYPSCIPSRSEDVLRTGTHAHSFVSSPFPPAAPSSSLFFMSLRLSLYPPCPLASLVMTPSPSICARSPALSPCTCLRPGSSCPFPYCGPSTPPPFAPPPTHPALDSSPPPRPFFSCLILLPLSPFALSVLPASLPR
ncbi:hypothetical protein HNY73_010922 [Argiope bruennichi]|uniref:Uncharacterized protein n=1 Tax=Argiope bruennichi TaxID=94029 RepID=A0A8T0F2I8_ARGBR|nr:hypothetical protein HNY73_010922 [Argiope bruennichi]